MSKGGVLGACTHVYAHGCMCVRLRARACMREFKWVGACVRVFANVYVDAPALQQHASGV